jgi:pimeloyl-ACP methyl ester carboxylesterase
MQKPTLLLIPGTACDERVWAYQQLHVADVADVVIADLSGAYTVDAMISQALVNMPDCFLLAGHSLGGWLCLEIVKRYPKRVKKLCLLSTQADLDKESVLKMRKKRVKLAKENHFDSIAADLAELFTYQKSVKPAVFSMFKDNRDLFISTQEVVIRRESNLSLLALIKQPTLVIVGRKDEIFFESTQYIAENIPDSQFTIIEDCGHMLTLEMPQEVTAWLRRWIISS